MDNAREHVVWAYRLLLGREPENEDAVRSQADFASVAQLRDAFLQSAEYLAQQAPPAPRFLSAPPAAVDIACTPEQLAAMCARIAAEWRRFGATDPHWSVLTNEAFRADRIDAARDAFYATAALDIAQIRAALARAGVRAERFGRTLDFGCGVGRLTLGMAAHCDHVTGVDISPPHLALARTRQAELGLANVAFETLEAVEDLDRYRDFDLVFSLLVLQHNPPPVMAALLERLLRALAPGGVAVLQLPTYLHGQTFAAAEYLASEQPAMEMNALPQRHVFAILEEAGCRLLDVREDDRIGTLPGVSNLLTVQRR
jgi:SAM-dependent methyltransferase